MTQRGRLRLTTAPGRPFMQHQPWIDEIAEPAGLGLPPANRKAHIGVGEPWRYRC